MVKNRPGVKTIFKHIPYTFRGNGAKRGSTKRGILRGIYFMVKIVWSSRVQSDTRQSTLLVHRSARYSCRPDVVNQCASTCSGGSVRLNIRRSLSNPWPRKTQPASASHRRRRYTVLRWWRLCLEVTGSRSSAV